MSVFEKPRAVATISLDGDQYHIAKNGQFTLVQERDRDFYDRPIAQPVSLRELNPSKLQALLDCLGEALEKLQGHEAARERRPGDVP